VGLGVGFYGLAVRRRGRRDSAAGRDYVALLAERGEGLRRDSLGVRVVSRVSAWLSA